MSPERYPMLISGRTAATRVEAPKADYVFAANMSGGFSLDLPGYSGAVSAGISTSVSWRDNGVFLSACAGTGGMLNLAGANWPSRLVSLPKFKPDFSIGGEFGRLQDKVFEEKRAEEYSWGPLTRSKPTDTGEWSWSVSPSLVFGVRGVACWKATLTARTVEPLMETLGEQVKGTMDAAMATLERIYRESLGFIGNNSQMQYWGY